MRGVNLEIDRLPVDALIIASHTGRFVLDLALHVGEISETAVGNMMEFGPFGSPGNIGGPVRVLQRIRGVFVFGNIDQLQDQGSSGDDATSARQEITADDVLQYG